MGAAREVVDRFYEATSSGKADKLYDLVVEDVTFRGPMMQAAGAAEYVAMNEQLLGFHRATRMLHQFEDGEDVCSIYEMDMSSPAGGSLTLTIADWIKVKGDRIAEQRIYFDPREFATAFGM